MLIIFTLPLLLIPKGAVGTHCVNESKDCAYYRDPSCHLNGYTGMKNTTMHGDPCLNWKDIKHHHFGNYHEDHNYCRNPSEFSQGPWCWMKSSENGEQLFTGCFRKCSGSKPKPSTTAKAKEPAVPEPYLRQDDPSLEVKNRKKWERKRHCPNNLEDGSTVSGGRESGWRIDNVTSVEGVDSTRVIFTLDNWTPRDFETLKLRVLLAQNNSMPIDLEIGQVIQFSKYRFNTTVQGVRSKEDIQSVQVIHPMKFFKFGIKSFESECSPCSRSERAEVTVQHEKNYAHSIANIHFVMNSPEFRKQFLMDQTKGTGWIERQRHLDWLLSEQRYDILLGTISRCFGRFEGLGSTDWVSVGEAWHDRYPQDITGRFAFVMAHELSHTWEYGHSDFALFAMETPVTDQLKNFSQQSIVQPKLAPQERYTDFVGLSAVFNTEEKALYIFSGSTYRILSLKEWSESNLAVKNECISIDPKTGNYCVNLFSPACKRQRSGDHLTKTSTTVFKTPCDVKSKVEKCIDDEDYVQRDYSGTFCYPPCNWKSFDAAPTGQDATKMAIYDAYGQANVESLRHCIRYDESCAWNEADNCKRYGAYSGKKATTVTGDVCKPWKETEHKNFEENYCRASSDKAPWCYKVSGGWDFCFSNCETEPVEYKSPVLPENDKLPACLDKEKSCAWNRYQKCRFELNTYEKNTTRLGEPCRTGSTCKSGNGFPPGCYKKSNNHWDYCFPDCLANLCLRNNGNCFLGDSGLCTEYLGDQLFDKMTTVLGRPCDPGHNGGRCVMKKVDSSPPWCFVDGKKEPCYKICTRHACLKEDESCAWNKRDVCKSDTAALRYEGTYAGGDDTTASGKKCNGGTCKSVRHGYKVYAPTCSNGEADEFCFKDCYEPSEDERSLVDRLYKDIRTGVKFTFLNTSGSKRQIGIVPFIRGQKPDEDQILYYSLDQKTLTLKEKKPLKDVLGGLWGPGRTLFNPQFLQDVGVFHGAQFCPFTGGALGPCTNVYTDETWGFLKKFTAGPAELDLVFDGGYGKAFFFKEKEFIVYDLNKNQMLDGYPKPVSSFLHQFGLEGQSFVALS